MSVPSLPAAEPVILEVGVASAALPGERTSGDVHVVREYAAGAMVAVLDGLGHGDLAAAAAQRGARELARRDGESVISLVRYCHQAVRDTRGVVLSLATFSTIDDTMTWMAIGNVMGVLVRADPEAAPRRERVVQRGGVVGLELPRLQTTTTTVAPGDLLVFATDGIHPDFVEDLRAGEAPQALAERILASASVGWDDALILAARYRGVRRGGES